MLGDSDDELLPDEDQDREDDPLQATSEELRRLRVAALRQHHSEGLERNGAPKEEPDEALEAENSTRLPPPPLPPWPTSLSRSEPPADAPRTRPLPGIRRPLAPPPSAPPSPSARRRTDPFLGSQEQGAAATLFLSPGARAFSLPGWRGFRRHSHWLIPGLLVAAFFVLVLVVNPHLPALSMLLIFAAIGLLQAGLLFYAPNDAFWAVSLVSGFVILLAVVFFAFFGPIFGFLLSILLVALGGVVVRERYYPVKEGTVVVMGLFGRYNRTLQPGFNLRAPGEKVLGVVETQRMRYEVRLPPIALFSGEQVTLSAAINYQVVPGQEYLAIRTAKDWQKPVQQQLVAVVQDVISLLSIDAFRRPAGGQRAPAGLVGLAPDQMNGEQEVSPLERINDRLTTVMREQVAERGIVVHTVKVHILEGPRLPGGAGSAGHPAQLSHAPMVMPAAQPGAGPGLESAHAGMPQGALPAPPIASPSRMAAMGTGVAPPGWPGQVVLPPYPPVSPIAPPAIGAAPRTGGASPPPMTPLSAQALAETYDAVMRHRITDLGTIRRIIAQFEAVAGNAELSQHVQFDAEAGARYLQNHLYQLEMRNAALLSPPSADDAAALPAPGEPEDD